jgi:hypothetical protein
MPVDITTPYRGIIIRMRSENESAMFPAIVKDALRKIASKPVGNKLLNGIVNYQSRSRFGYTVCIRRPANMTIANGTWCGTNKAVRASEIDAKDSKIGSVTVIDFNANIMNTPDGSRPAFIGLAHELIHAYYNLKGKAFLGAEEELATVGISKVKNRSITENAIREEHGIKLREAYSGL